MVKVSVIVPVFNVERYLSRCLDSLVHQTLQEIEILVINDGSTDFSQAIIDSYQTQYPAIIKSFTKPNGGLSDARNYGLERISGEFIGFVDADDYVTSTMFEHLYKLAQKNQAEIVVCNLQKVSENGQVLQQLPQIPNMPERIDLEKHFSVFADLGCFACNKIYKREIIEKHRFKKGMHYEDIQLIPQLILQSTTLAQTQEYHYHYFERSDSISKTHTIKGLDIFEAIEDVERAFQKSKYNRFKRELKNFQILQGVYTFLAYWGYVKDNQLALLMERRLKEFTNQRNIRLKDLLTYKRFGKNYLISIPFKKRIFYLLYFFHQSYWIKLLK